jgi:hypothetical protein
LQNVVEDETRRDPRLEWAVTNGNFQMSAESPFTGRRSDSLRT